MHSIHPSPPRLALVGTAALLLALMPALPASAHDQLVTATPAEGGTVSSASSVDLTFDAAVLELGGGRNAITVTGTGGRHFETACARIEGDAMSVPVALGGAGDYTVTWRAVSSDGHPVGDSYSFDYRPAAGAAAAEGSTTSPCADADAVAQPTASTGVPGGAIVAGAVGGGVVLAAVVAVLLVVLRSRRREEQGAER
ncbi:copper resistance CopC family protein [Amnibacterium endophyticum]|uniref:Copper resistance protein CopC n=1 Tax=Amnibacterium endophyticum TaxID=2109337 RepID=A0ABW4LHS2_9MICO